MIWFYDGAILHNLDTNDKVSLRTFEYLTGKKITWGIRHNKKIITKRIGPHIKLHDEKFIMDEFYKRDNIIYKCEFISADDIALLIPLGISFNAVSTSNTDEWEIVNEGTINNRNNK